MATKATFVINLLVKTFTVPESTLDLLIASNWWTSTMFALAGVTSSMATSSVCTSAGERLPFIVATAVCAGAGVRSAILGREVIKKIKAAPVHGLVERPE